MRQKEKTRWLAVILAAVLLAGQPALGQTPAPSKQEQKQSAEREKGARRAFARGQQAEAAGEWEQAFALYSQAANQAPSQGEYLMRREAARFQVMQQHVDRAERAAVEGKLELARTELRAALALDPAYDVARERLAQLEPRPVPAQPVAPDQHVVQLRPRPGTQSFDVRGDTRRIYDEVGRQFGLTAAVDADLRGRETRFRVNDVDFATAIKVLGQQTDTFIVPLDPKSFLVADDTPQKRRELAPVVLRTISLAGFASPEDMTEMVRLVREIGGVTRTQLDTRTRTLTVRDTPDAVALAMKLVEDLEQAAGELMLEVEVLEVDRNLTRRLGVTPPSNAKTFTISPADITEAQQSPEGLLRVLQRVFGIGGPGSFTTGVPSLGPLIPPLIAIGGGKSVVLATLPGATAEFADTVASLRGARRMMLRALDGEQATFFIGERFPIAFSVLSQNFVGAPGSVGATSLAQTNLTAADGPAALAAGDFNSDGFLDLVAANANDNSVSFFPGNGDGTFGDRTDIPVGTAPSAIVAADFNSDGRVDIAVANEQSNTVSLLLGNGDGTFAAPVDFPVGAAPRGMVAADFNGDSLPDLAVTNSGDGTVSILLNTGGTFAPQTTLIAGAGPHGIVAADLNGDSFQDLAVTNENDNTVLLYFGVGDGTFTGGAGFQTGATPVAVASADVNSDGFQDLLVANQVDDTISLFTGNGDGTFSTVTNFAVGDAPSAITVADFTADGFLDIVVTDFGSDTFTVLVGIGTGAFPVRADFQVGDGPSAALAVDLTGDGRRDLAVANREGDTVAVIVNRTGNLPSSPFQPTPYPGFQYEDLGLKVRATPRMHRGGEVTLQLQIEIRSRSGQDLNGIPVISNRTVEQTVRLKENEPTVLTGIIQHGNTAGVLGWPGLARVPVAGKRSKDDQETELILSITPRRLRLADRVNRQYYAGRDAGRPTPTPTPQPPQ